MRETDHPARIRKEKAEARAAAIAAQPQNRNRWLAITTGELSDGISQDTITAPADATGTVLSRALSLATGEAEDHDNERWSLADEANPQPGVVTVLCYDEYGHNSATTFVRQ